MKLVLSEKQSNKLLDVIWDYLDMKFRANESNIYMEDFIDSLDGEAGKEVAKLQRQVKKIHGK